MDGRGQEREKDEKEARTRHRLKGLFSKEKKATSDGDVDEFLRGPSDKLHFPAPTPTFASQHRQLSRIDTNSAPRWPTAAEVLSSGKTRGRSKSLGRSRKGLVVRFTEEQPEIIGEGGDEAEEPTMSLRQRAHSHPSARQPGRKPSSRDGSNVRQPGYEQANTPEARSKEAFRPGPMRHKLLPLEPTLDLQSGPTQGNPPIPDGDPAVQPTNNGHLRSGSHGSISLAARVREEMRVGEGQALLQAASNRPKAIDEQFSRRESLETDSASKNDCQAPVPPSSVAAADESRQEFSKRVARLFTLFRLSAESMRPLSKCSLEEFVRAALWWFLKGRLNLEATVRDRPVSPEAQQTNFFARQQAYADLAKSLWIVEKITPQCPEASNQQNDPNVIDILESRQSILSNLRKLASSMQRNNFLPPEDATLPQGLDTTIWVQDDGNSSLIASQKQSFAMSLSDALPLGDSSRNFHYGRVFADAVLMEEAESQRYRSPVLISIVRGHTETALTAIVVSQNGMLKLCIQSDKSLGPTWDNATWNSKSNVLDIKLPRGFLLRLQCSPQDFRTLRGIYDYKEKIHGGLVPQLDEEIVFETIVKTFQCFGQDAKSTIPKQPLTNCRLRLFEKTLVEKAAAGTRSMHKGFRIGLVTSPKTKGLSGINQDLPPHRPIQFGLLRGEGGLPALLLKVQLEKSKYTIVLTFSDVSERTQMHTRLTGVALGDKEFVVVQAGAKGFSIASGSTEEGPSKALKALNWQSLKVINEEQDDTYNHKTVLSKNLRVVMDFKEGSLTDRVNIGPGELKVCLDVNFSNELKVLRQPQQDMTISVSESQVPRELPAELAELLKSIGESETARTYTFHGREELHLFQTALTGFSVLFDGVAASFNISRRRMVVPIYKKLDAAETRLQLVQRDKIVQMVAFFQNFSHGDCMNFTLKSTDIFEGSSRSGKFSLRIVDAKFAMPKGRVEGGAGIDSGFVCLDLPEYPGEHDDITIVFTDEADYEKFTKALPAPVKAASRMGSVRR